ncbi:DUF397 domain-containing protein [Yinghuangia sp. YIM S09857]|uniref:DUF397 domain-containing protein n=1 Tax=Yinghuangia sp. YIM S09857 TaxID=3436929 RepID=UPI003F5349AF
MPGRFTHWRVSARTDGANTCVEVATDDTFVAVQNSTLRHPSGPMLIVPVPEWEAFLRELIHGAVDYSTFTTGMAGPFRLKRDRSETITMTDARAPAVAVRFTQAEWDVFVHGARIDGEFTVDWLRSHPDTVNTTRS